MCALKLCDITSKAALKMAQKLPSLSLPSSLSTMALLSYRQRMSADLSVRAVCKQTVDQAIN